MLNKLKNNRGATMILALALFLICVMVSSIILVVASSGATRVSQQVEEQQKYLAVSSAADVVATELDKCNKCAFLNGAPDSSNTDATGVFGGAAKTLANRILENSPEQTLLITVGLSETDARLQNATCEFKMRTDYSMEIIVKTDDSDYSIVVRSYATVTDREEPVDADGDGNPDVDADNNLLKTVTKTIVWSAPEVTKGVGN